MGSKHCLCTVFAVAVFSMALSQPLGQPAVLKDTPEEVLFRLGKQLQLECEVESGDAAGAKFEWKSSTQDLKTNPNVLQNDRKLVIKETKDSDEGLYQCIATTSAGIATTRRINVKKTFIQVPQKSTKKIKPVEGRPFQLGCPPVQGYPKPKVEWKKRSIATGKLESFLSPRIFSPQGDLYFANATHEDVSKEYNFVCLVSSPAVDGEVELIEWAIEELAKDSRPADNEVVQQYVSKDMTARVGDVTEIYCVYGGNPMPHPDWWKDGVNVNNKPGDRVTRYNRSKGKRLLIKETWAEDEGEYTCIIDNGIGKVQKHSMRLSVIIPPKFLKRPEKRVTLKEGETLLLPCEVGKTTGSTEIVWTYNTKEISGRPVNIDSKRLKIEKVKKSDTGYYGCRVITPHGEIYAESLVQVS